MGPDRRVGRGRRPLVYRGQELRCGWRFEQEAWAQGYANVAGADEVGRGALCGPVVAGAVILGEPLLDGATQLAETFPYLGGTIVAVLVILALRSRATTRMENMGETASDRRSTGNLGGLDSTIHRRKNFYITPHRSLHTGTQRCCRRHFAFTIAERRSGSFRRLVMSAQQM